MTRSTKKIIPIQGQRNDLKSLFRRIDEMKLPYLRVSLTQDCNAACTFCHNEGQKIGERGLLTAKHKSTLSIEQYEQIADLFKEKFPKVLFTGGEPTLAENLPDVVKVFASRGYRTHMTTNGFFFDEDIQVALKQAGLSRINVSLHSLEQEQYQRVFNVEADIQTTLRNIRTLSRHFAPEVTKFNFFAIDGDNVPSQLAPMSELSAETGIMISLLSAAKANNATDSMSKSIVHRLTGIYGPPDTQGIPDKFGMRYLHRFRNGAVWEIDDFREEEYRKASFDNSECRPCVKKEQCVEGPYGLRLSHTGLAMPCLIRKDNATFLFSK